MRRMTSKDIPAAVELSNRVGWNHKTTDWERHLHWAGTGSYCLQNPYGTNLIATAIAYQFGKQRGWIGQVITDPGYRGRGFGARMTQTAIDHLTSRDVQEIMLDASNMGLPLYEKLGFRTLHNMDTYMGVLSANIPPAPDPNIRPMTLEDLPAVVALDEFAFGAARPHILEDIFKRGAGWFHEEDGEIQGVMIAFKSRALYAKLGPWIHRTPEGAKRLWAAVLPELAGLEIRVDIAESNEAAAQLLKKAQMRRVQSCARMILGDKEPLGESAAYHGAASLAVG
jgi:GNAT superfamily N-acetyltransferase